MAVPDRPVAGTLRPARKTTDGEEPDMLTSGEAAPGEAAPGEAAVSPERVEELPSPADHQPTVDAADGLSLLDPGAILHGRYRINALAGRGGQSVVYEAEHLGLSRKVAVKEIRADSGDSFGAMERFHEEARLLGRLEHPSIPHVYDFFSERDRSYLVMDFIDGQTLAQAVAAMPGFVPENTVLRWTLQLCDVLTYLHSQSPPIVFRDLKPTNVMLNRAGRVQLIDFGIARFFKPGQRQDTTQMGTDGYCAPEQHGAGQTDARSDVYSLGACMHFLLTRSDPAGSAYRFPPVREVNASVSRSTGEVISKSLQFLPQDRYSTIQELKRALEVPGDEQPTSGLARAVHAPEPLAALPTRASAQAGFGWGMLAPILLCFVVAVVAAPQQTLGIELACLCLMAVTLMILQPGALLPGSRHIRRV